MSSVRRVYVEKKPEFAVQAKELKQEINRPCKETEKGFGLANVNERIHMYFGDQYGIRMQSEKGNGTIVEITIPAVKADTERQKV